MYRNSSKNSSYGTSEKLLSRQNTTPWSIETLEIVKNDAYKKYFPFKDATLKFSRKIFLVEEIVIKPCFLCQTPNFLFTYICNICGWLWLMKISQSNSSRMINGLRSSWKGKLALYASLALKVFLILHYRYDLS